MIRYLYLLAALFISLMVQAREPYGNYVAKYIVTKENGRTNYHSIYNPIKITTNGIQVKNTNAGTKTWEATYQGPVKMSNAGGTERFHNFYLTRQRVEFSISDRPAANYNGQRYYIIIFDGQLQLAVDALY